MAEIKIFTGSSGDLDNNNPSTGAPLEQTLLKIHSILRSVVGVDSGAVTTTGGGGGSSNVNINQVGGNAVSTTLPVSSQPSSGTLSNASGTITAANTAQTALAASSVTRYLLIQNSSNGSNIGTLWVNFGTTAVENQPSILLMPGDTLVFESGFVPTQLISVIGTVTGQQFTIKYA